MSIIVMSPEATLEEDGRSFGVGHTGLTPGEPTKNTITNCRRQKEEREISRRKPRMESGGYGL